jgi:hypothetical protein
MITIPLPDVPEPIEVKPGSVWMRKRDRVADMVWAHLRDEQKIPLPAKVDVLDHRHDRWKPDEDVTTFREAGDPDGAIMTVNCFTVIYQPYRASSWERLGDPRLPTE